MEPLFHYQFRLILVGDSTVGKSSLLKYFTEGRFSEVCDPTVGVDFYARLVEVRPGVRVKLQLWDTAGQEKFRSITRSYYRNSVGVLLLYDVANRQSFEHVPAWLHEAQANVSPNAVFQLVGHKADKEEDRAVLFEEGEYLAKYHQLKFLETSALSGKNVEEAFLLIAREIYAKVESGAIAVEEGWEGVRQGFVPRADAISLSDSRYDNSSSSCPC